MEKCFFWATHTGARLDLLMVWRKSRWGFEVKRTLAPNITRSMRSVLADFKLTWLNVIDPNDDTFKAGPRDPARSHPQRIEATTMRCVSTVR